MAYKVEFTPKALKQLSKLDKSIKKRIDNYLLKLSSLDNPRSLGKALQGELSTIWSYRVGNYRLLAKIIDDEIVIIVLKIDHRKQIYK